MSTAANIDPAESTEHCSLSGQQNVWAFPLASEGIH